MGTRAKPITCVARKDAGGIRTTVTLKRSLPPPYDQVHEQLRKAVEMVNKAEHDAMCVDGPMSPTRQMFTNEEFDVMARHVIRAFRILEKITL